MERRLRRRWAAPGPSSMRPALLLLAVVAARAGAAAAEGAGAGTEAAGRSFAVAAYLPEWRYEGANWEVICTHTSHLILFSLEVSAPALSASQVTPKRFFSSSIGNVVWTRRWPGSRACRGCRVGA